MIKRIFDFVFSLIGVVLMLPFFLVIALIILFTSNGGVFYFQKRVGKNGNDFLLIKFRTMRIGSDQKGLLTVGGRDSRITKVGYFLRKYKLDELPQLINVLIGDMSLVGPRPEVRKYVEMYNHEQLNVLKVKPGITDYASIKFIDESEILGKSSNPEKIYIEEIMQEKLRLNLNYVECQSFFEDLKIILLTVAKIFR